MTPLHRIMEYNANSFSRIFIYIVILTYIFYGLLFIGVVLVDVKYLRVFSILVQICIAFFLIIRFNPFRTNIQLREGDSRIIYSSGIFLLINLMASEFTIYFSDSFKKIIGTKNDDKE
jgi:hypothetical protein